MFFSLFENINPFGRAGLDLLLKEKPFWFLVSRLRDLEAEACGQAADGAEETWLEVKAALWGVAHVASAPGGSQELEREGVLATLINLAESCPVLTIKATAYYALGNTKALIYFLIGESG
jgi:hypothetical protein